MRDNSWIGTIHNDISAVESADSFEILNSAYSISNDDNRNAAGAYTCVCVCVWCVKMFWNGWYSWWIDVRC